VAPLERLKILQQVRERRETTTTRDFRRAAARARDEGLTVRARARDES